MYDVCMYDVCMYDVCMYVFNYVFKNATIKIIIHFQYCMKKR